MSFLSFLFLITFTYQIFLFPTSHAFNITKMLDQQGGFSTFNNLLSQTQLATAINNHQTITVLVVSDDDNHLSQLSGKPTSIIKKILSLHVILDYYDTEKLKNLRQKSVIVTTLYQTTGQAKGQEGFLNVTVMKNGDVAFGSAIPGSSLGAKFVKSVVSQPHNISVLQISNVITTDFEIDAPTTSPPAPPTESPKKAPSSPPTKSPKKAPSSEEPPTESPSADSPDDASSPAPTDGPTGEEGSNADAPSDHSSIGTKASQINPSLTIAVMLLMSFFWW